MTLDEEKLKVRYEHRLHVWRILIEKGLLGILLGLALLAANMLIEDFKSDLSRQRFLLESRLTALQALRESYSLLSNHLWHLANEDRATSEKRLLPAYGKDLDKFIHLANKWSPLFSASFNKAVEQHVFTHTAVSGELRGEARTLAIPVRRVRGLRPHHPSGAVGRDFRSSFSRSGAAL